MRSLVSCALLALAAISCGGSSGALRADDPRPRVGVIDLQRVLLESRDGKEAQRRLLAHRAERQREVDRKKQEVEAIADEAARTRAYDELRTLFAGYQEELKREEAEATRAIFERVSAMMDELASRDRLLAIVEKRGDVLWQPEGPLPDTKGAPRVDLTDDALARLDGAAR